MSKLKSILHKVKLAKSPLTEKESLVNQVAKLERRNRVLTEELYTTKLALETANSNLLYPSEFTVECIEKPVKKQTRRKRKTTKKA